MTADSAPSTAVGSPEGSPTASASSTSLSSLASEDDYQQKKPQSKKLLDGYGNEFEIHDYTINDIRNAIPKHCFERSAATGLYYVARDIVTLVGTFYLFNKFVTPENIPSYGARWALWALYTVIQGLVGTGLWVLAHECGHQSFSDSKHLQCHYKYRM
jgi:omega-6 fatty acid desaturase (delta-12 desaturase)